MSAPPSFAVRIARRWRLWWAVGGGPWTPARLRALLDRGRQHYTQRRREDPERLWHRGVFWQRALANKWNSREFALRHGCRVPHLHWHGRRVSRLPWDRLPDQFVLRATVGYGRSGVYVLDSGFELLRGRRIGREEIESGLRRHLARHGFVTALAEEFLRTEEGEHRLPTEYSCYTFAGEPELIERKRRLGVRGYAYRCYRPSWEPVPEPFWAEGTFALDAVHPPPRCLSELLATARTLGGAYGGFVRVDLFATDRGAVFGEFASVPYFRGATPFADEFLGRLWEERCPEAD